MSCRVVTTCLLTLPFLLVGCADSSGPKSNSEGDNTPIVVAPEPASSPPASTSAPETAKAAETPEAGPPPTDQFATPRQAVRTMLAAAQAGDASLLGTCFAEEAPGEFQVFRSGKATSKQIDEFKDFVQEAQVGEEKIDESKQKAVVQVEFKRRAEELNLVKTTAGWKVVDF